MPQVVDILAVQRQWHAVKRQWVSGSGSVQLARCGKTLSSWMAPQSRSCASLRTLSQSTRSTPQSNHCKRQAEKRTSSVRHADREELGGWQERRCSAWTRQSKVSRHTHLPICVRTIERELSTAMFKHRDEHIALGGEHMSS